MMNFARQEREKKTEEFFSRKIDSHHFAGIQYLVLDSSGTVFEYAGGWADVAGQKQLQHNTTMMIYSMTKTLTAAAVLQLVENEKISLDEPVEQYLPYIPYDKRVTVRHLLSQTSGIPNPIPLKWVHLAEEHSTFDEDGALKAVLKDNPKLVFTPRKKYAYSNIYYWLLGKVIEKVTGMKYEDYTRENVFNKLHMSQTETDFVIPSPHNHSKGYLPKYSFMNLLKTFLIDSKFIGEYEDRWLQIKNHYLNGAAFGGIVSSARSIGKFLQDQLRDESVLFNKDTKSLFYQQQKNNNGDFIEMTLGWHIGTSKNGRYFFKEGGGGGFHSEMRIYPVQGTATVVIVNNTPFNSKEFLNTIDKEFVS